MLRFARRRAWLAYVRLKPHLLPFGWAIAGLRRAVRTEGHLRLHLAAAGAVVAAGVLLRLSPLEWAVLWLAIGLVITAEVANTAVELAVDVASRDPHPLAGAAKDVAAGAVLVASLTAALVGLCLFGPKVLALFG